MGISNIDHFELVVHDIDRALNFYRGLGVGIEETTGEGREGRTRRRAYLRVGTAEQINVVTPEDVGGLRRKALAGGGHVCLVWDGSMDELVQHLAANGLAPDRGPGAGSGARGGGNRIFVNDPDGNSVEIMVYA